MAKKKRPQKLVEIARSFSYKLNVGNFESRDFFCSRKQEATVKEAVKVSEMLFKFCEDEVIKSVRAYQLENLPVKEPVKATGKDFAKAKKEAPQREAEEKKAEELGEDKLKEDSERAVNESASLATEGEGLEEALPIINEDEQK